MKPTLLYTFYIWGEYLCSDKTPEIQGKISDSQHLKTNFVTSLMTKSEQITVVRDTKKKLKMFFSKVGSEKK